MGYILPLTPLTPPKGKKEVEMCQVSAVTVQPIMMSHYSTGNIVNNIVMITLFSDRRSLDLW